MVEEVLKTFCRLKSSLGKVKRDDLLKVGVDEGKLGLVLKNNLLRERDGALELTDKGETVLLNHREGFLHESIHHGEEKRPHGAVDHWARCHQIDRHTLREVFIWKGEENMMNWRCL